MATTAVFFIGSFPRRGKKASGSTLSPTESAIPGRPSPPIASCTAFVPSAEPPMPRTRRWVHFARRAAASREIARASFSRNGRSGKPISPRRCFPASVSTASSTIAIIFRKSGAAIPSPPRRLLSPTREKSKRNRIPSPMSPSPSIDTQTPAAPPRSAGLRSWLAVR